MWTTLTLDPRTLTDARLLAHWGSQLLAATGARLLPGRSDDSHTSLHFERELRALVGENLDTAGTRVGLRLTDFAIVVFQAGREHSALWLDGKTLQQGLTELRPLLASALAREVGRLELMSYDMVDHPLGSGAKFDTAGKRESLDELERWIANAHDLLERFAAGDERASRVRLWPHHFDIASLLTLHADDDPEPAKSVNVGFSFGDSSYPEPYVYVSPWPYPADGSQAPPLNYGKWHDQGFFAAVFLGSDLLHEDPEGQAQRAETFLTQASSSLRSLLGVT